MNDKELLFKHFEELLQRAEAAEDAETCINYTECALKVCLMMNQVDNLKAGSFGGSFFDMPDGGPKM